MNQGRRILFADDDWQLHRAVTRVAEQDGYEVVHVTTGTDVVARAIESQPDLIILDVNFPDADGRDVLTALKLEKRTAGIPVLVWSGDKRDTESHRKIALTLGAEDYVEKVDAGTLLGKVRRLLLRLDSDGAGPLSRS
jgi:DNA-binding response OmpR family regulator